METVVINKAGFKPTKKIDIAKFKKDFSDLTVLFVEDESKALMDGATILESLFQKVYTAKDGEEALAVFVAENPDIILSDVRMPIMDGVTLCEHIRKINIDVPFVLLTAYSDEKHLISAINAGVDGFLQKPMDLPKTLSTLQKHAKILRSKIDLERQMMLNEVIINLTPGFIFVLDHELDVVFSNDLILKYYNDVDMLIGDITIAEHVAQVNNFTRLDIASIPDGTYSVQLNIGGVIKTKHLQKRTIPEVGWQIFHILS